MPGLPTGTVTFLFTDIEGSTRLLQQLGDRYAEVLAAHHRLLRSAIQDAHGHEMDAQASLDDVIERATARPAVAVRRPDLGTLRPGSPATLPCSGSRRATTPSTMWTCGAAGARGGS